MPEMTLLGWFHTVLGVGAVLSTEKTLTRPDGGMARRPPEEQRGSRLCGPSLFKRVR